jgi:hypothetical protein
MNTVCICYDENGNLVQVASAEPIRCIVVDERSTHDRCYELRSERGVLQIGADRVRAVLNGGPIWTYDTIAPNR